MPQTQHMSVPVMARGSAYLLSSCSVLQNPVLCCKNRWSPGKDDLVIDVCRAVAKSWLLPCAPGLRLIKGARGQQGSVSQAKGWGGNQRAAGTQWSSEGFLSQERGYDLPIIRRKREKAMAPHSSSLAWKIPWTEEPGGLQSVGSLRAGHD